MYFVQLRIAECTRSGVTRGAARTVLARSTGAARIGWCGNDQRHHHRDSRKLKPTGAQPEGALPAEPSSPIADCQGEHAGGTP
jgi:hypothetical protein